jgi:hypothetical protein
VATACRKVLEDPSFRLTVRGFQAKILGLPGIARMVTDLAAMVA